MGNTDKELDNMSISQNTLSHSPSAIFTQNTKVLQTDSPLLKTFLPLCMALVVRPLITGVVAVCDSRSYVALVLQQRAVTGEVCHRWGQFTATR
ncbi:hypothetical protein E2C01_032263 [Portunus trituberculatus]|uniref:Uncharacterized protein n=1 Tax=Portunus trituberculatus TaxID=210409 RepID=A0A5B7EVK7_PORTR|nr:hypothetical protein [Portunus trituberculatus]